MWKILFATFSVIFFWNVEGVEKLVVVVDRQVHGAGSRLDHRFEIVKHVDVGIGSQLSRNQKLLAPYFG